MADFKGSMTPEQRAMDVYHHIDAGFINRRKAYSFLSEKAKILYDEKKSNDTNHMAELANDHLLITLSLLQCKALGVPSLSALLQAPGVGHIFTCTEKVQANKRVYKDERCRSRVLPTFRTPYHVFLDYSTRHIYADTQRYLLGKGAIMSIIAHVAEVTNDVVVAHPIAMGAPWLDHPFNKDLGLNLMWYGCQYFQVFPEDIDEFQQMKDIVIKSPKQWMQYMKTCPEREVKEAFAHLLGESCLLDWGGEQADLYASALHIRGKRFEAAFLLKGPSRFEPMTPRHFGKQGDQVYRLACTPANVLVVQHSHEIAESARATVRAFAVPPHDPRRYCLIDGKDTFRILAAYGYVSART